MSNWFIEHLQETKTYQINPKDHSILGLYILHIIFGLREGIYFIFQGLATIRLYLIFD